MFELNIKYKEGNFEANITISENCNKFAVSKIEFYNLLITVEDLDSCAGMMHELSDILRKLNGDN